MTDHGFTKESFIEQCIAFAELDCNNLGPSLTNMTSFFKSAKEIYVSATTQMTCIVDAIKLIPGVEEAMEEFDEAVTLFNDWFAQAVQGTYIGYALNVLTGGIWAGVKSAYYIIKLGVRVYQAIKKYTAEYTASGLFNWLDYGEILGIAYQVGESLTGARRRKRLIKLKKLKK